MKILGISCVYHDAAAAVAVDGRLGAAVAFERLSRQKHTGLAVGPFWESFGRGIRTVLHSTGLALHDIDLVVASHISEIPPHQLADQIARNGGVNFPATRFRTVPHHFAPACSAAYLSGWKDTAVMVIDGGGAPYRCLRGTGHREPPSRRMEAVRAAPRRPSHQEDLREMESYYDVDQGTFTTIRKVFGEPLHATIGAQYSAATTVLFGNPLDCGKTMGLAAYGSRVSGNHFLPSEGLDRGSPHSTAERSPLRRELEEQIQCWKSNHLTSSACLGSFSDPSLHGLSFRPLL